MNTPVSQNPLVKTHAYINGQWLPSASGAGFAVTNPATGQTLARVADCNAADTHAAIGAAHSALAGWKALLPKERSAILKRWHQLVLGHADELAKLLTAEQGKPLSEAKGEVAAGAATIEWAAEEAKRVYGHTIPPFKPGSRAITTREPLGVVAAITPWNFPHSMVTRKVAPALAAGCTVILKPAEDTPLSALALAVLAEQAGIPAGVLNILPTSNPAEAGSVLAADTRVKKLSFTGSTEVGRKLMAACAPTLKRLSLELGGNAPFIVFDDADITAAVNGIMASKFRNNGQTCICANRIFIQNGIYEKLAEALKTEIGKLQLGDGLAPTTTTGPLINLQGLEKVEYLIEDARHKGAKLACGGKRSALGGTFFEPTLLLGATPSMALSQDEIFGPVAALYPFATEQEAITLANATEYGLAAYFYTRDIGRAMRMAEALEYGMVGVNECLLASESVPFGGIKQSGFGREGGPDSLDDFTAIKYTLFGGL